MPYVNESNFDSVLTPDVRNEYWRRVKFALRTYFREPEELSDRFRGSIEAASIPEQLLVYHKDPLTTAADLASVREVLPKHVEDYGKRFSDQIAPKN